METLVPKLELGTRQADTVTSAPWNSILRRLHAIYEPQSTKYQDPSETRANTKILPEPTSTMSTTDVRLPKRLWRIAGGIGVPPTIGEWRGMLERRKQRRKEGVTCIGWADSRGGGLTIAITSGKGAKQNKSASQVRGSSSSSGSVRPNVTASNGEQVVNPTEAHGAPHEAPRAEDEHHD